MKERFWALIALIVMLMFGLTGCSKKEDFVIGISSELTFAREALERVGKDNGVQVKVVAKGSLDLVNDFTSGKQIPYDMIWLPSKGLVDAGDVKKAVSRTDSSIMWSPVLPLVLESRAKQLGWLDKEFTNADFFAAVDSKLPFAMSSPTQSFAGQAGFLGFSNYLAGNPDMLLAEHFENDAYKLRMKKLLSKMNKTAPSTSALRDYIIDHTDAYQALVSYESTAFEMNTAFKAKGSGERFCALIPVDGVVVADYPVGFIDKGNSQQLEFYTKLVTYLKSPEFQRFAEANGRRTGKTLLKNAKVSGDACFDMDRKVHQVQLPRPEVVTLALTLYQEVLRKPTRIIWVADFSPSMDTNGGHTQLMRASQVLFDPKEAPRWGLQPTARDVHVFVPFGGVVGKVLRVAGNDPKKLFQFVDEINHSPTIDSTQLYVGLAEAVKIAERDFPPSDEYFTAIIALTDGDSQSQSYEEAIAGIKRLAQKGIPTYAVAFGDPNMEQLNALAEAQQTGGSKWLVVDGRGDLVLALRKARGQN